ncbi:Argonaute siRNA chaperone complex subunit Arb1-domain-containing protein [Biscogniauxia sp. FL1348]|nr:Argonaute siRNA chaperone complex subunit Arb1-domain-containing protein [Biscogniauxia sp. FL1348]
MANLPGDSVAKPAGDVTAQPAEGSTATTAATTTTTATTNHEKKVTFDQGSESEIDHVEKSGDRVSTSDHSGLISLSNEDPPNGDHVAGAVVEDGSQQLQEKTKKKRKPRKRTPASRRGITGFEEFYADAPMTPAEAALGKKDLYSPMRPFSDRIEECIQRYRSRRRLDSERCIMFNKYLFLGGIDSSPRQFTGMAEDVDSLADADAAEVRRMTAIDFVGGAGNRFYDPANAEDWEVDFEAIVKGFLSRSIPDMYMYDEEAIDKAASLVKNFLNYVLMHDVCPEYRDNILAARDICDAAPTELRYVHELRNELPGPFNSAARQLFCNGGADDLDDPKNLEAWYLFRITMLVWAADHQAAKDALIQNAANSTTPPFRVLRTREQQTYRVTEVERPYHKDVVKVKAQLAQAGAGQGDIPAAAAPVALIRAVPDVMEHGWGNVPRPDEITTTTADNIAHEETFLIEDELAAKIVDGMKMRMTVCELGVNESKESGDDDAVVVLRFIKDVDELRVSFDTFLPQYLMTNWKDPVPNDRPAPSVHDKNTDGDGYGDGGVEEV